MELISVKMELVGVQMAFIGVKMELISVKMELIGIQMAFKVWQWRVRHREAMTEVPFPGRGIGRGGDSL